MKHKVENTAYCLAQTNQYSNQNIIFAHLHRQNQNHCFLGMIKKSKKLDSDMQSYAKTSTYYLCNKYIYMRIPPRSNQRNSSFITLPHTQPLPHLSWNLYGGKTPYGYMVIFTKPSSLYLIPPHGCRLQESINMALHNFLVFLHYEIIQAFNTDFQFFIM